MKKYITLILSLLAGLFFASFVSKETIDFPKESISIATWNIRNLNLEKKNENLKVIAKILKRYDLIAIQETEDPRPLMKLKIMMKGYDYIVSKRVGGTYGYGEHYAYFYKTSTVKFTGTKYIYDDPNDYFTRPPYVASFKAGLFDFVLINIHILYGGSEKRRRPEIKKLDELLLAIEKKSKGEEDIILLGDFNFPRDDYGFEIKSHRALVSPYFKTLVTDSISFDNIWINVYKSREYTGLFEVFPFDDVLLNGNDNFARGHISDHRPVYAYFRTTLKDDDGENAESGDYVNVRIRKVYAHPTDKESISLKNYSKEKADISGWTLGDRNAPKSFRIKEGTTLNANEEITFHKKDFGFGINNKGEVLYLFDDKGEIRDSFAN